MEEGLSVSSCQVYMILWFMNFKFYIYKIKNVRHISAMFGHNPSSFPHLAHIFHEVIRVTRLVVWFTEMALVTGHQVLFHEMVQWMIKLKRSCYMTKTTWLLEKAWLADKKSLLRILDGSRGKLILGSPHLQPWGRYSWLLLWVHDSNNRWTVWYEGR